MSSSCPVAIVTGAAQGIGYAITDILLREGYKVCLSDINEEKGRESAAELQKKYPADRIIFVECDVRSKESFEDVFKRTQKEFGGINVVVNNAGVLDEFEPERTIAINLMGPIIGSQLALKFMGTSNGGKGGAVVNVASMAGLIPLKNIPVYAATKHGVIGLTRSYGDQEHFDKNGVIFMAICPFFVKTPLVKNPKALIDFSPKVMSMALEPESVAEGVVTLLKDRRNGSTLMALPEGNEYVELQDKLKKISWE